MTTIERATEAWGSPLPDWVEALARECDRLGQRAVAAKVGYSATVINRLLQNRYGREAGAGRGSRAAAEQAVRGALMQATVTCPFLGEIPADQCSTNQRLRWSPHNPQRIALYHACRSGCEHSRLEKSK